MGVTTLTSTSCCAQLPAISGGGALAAPTPPDLATALSQLQEAVNGLQAAVDALAGASGVAGAAPTSSAIEVAEPPVSADAPSPSAQPTAPPLPPTTGGGGSGGVRDRIVEAARAELAKGVSEDAGSDNDSGGNIKRYRSAVTGPGEDPNLAEAWCADFASYVWKQAGAPFGKDGRGEDWTVGMLNYAKETGTWQPREGSTPKPGDMVLFAWDGDGRPDHVAVVEKVEGDKVFTIGGNESNKIRNQSYSLGDGRIIGYIPPAGG